MKIIDTTKNKTVYDNLYHIQEDLARRSDGSMDGVPSVFGAKGGNNTIITYKIYKTGKYRLEITAKDHAQNSATPFQYEFQVGNHHNGKNMIQK